MKVFWQHIEALKITINKLYINRCIFSLQKDAVLNLTFYLIYKI